MEDAMAARYWCHMCSQMVNPIGDVEIKCPFCQSGFVEEMSSPTAARDSQEPDPEFGADRALSLWAPILLGMMGNSRRRRRVRRADGEGGYEDENDHDGESRPGEESELDREIESIIRRRRRSSATILQLLQGIQAGMAAESENAGGDRDRERERDRDREREIGGGDRERERERERVILINPFNQTIIVQGASHDPNQNHNPVGSLGDYFIGPGLDLLLQHLAENDPNRHGTPPAKKEAVEAMPTVKIEEVLQCSVCLDDMEAGTEAKEMPCKHKFHPDCILPWLEIHSSCPVCRFQMPADESKRESDGAARDGSSIREGVGETVNGRRLSFPWPFTGLFSPAPAPHGLGLFPSGNAPPTGLFPPAPPGNAPSSTPPGNGNASQTQPDDD